MKVKNLVLGIGIFIVFMFLLHNGIRAFYAPTPTYGDFCDDVRMPLQKEFDNEMWAQDTCEEDGGTWRNGYCDFYFECQQEYDNARNDHSKVVFIIALIVGIMTLIVGFAVLSVEPVGSSLMASGIGAIVYGTIVNWENLGNWGRFLLLLIAFILLIWIALRLNTEKKKGFWQKLGLKK